MNRRTGHQPKSFCRRGGWQLIELMAVISLTAILLTASAQLLVLVMGMENRVGAGLADGLTLSQFSQQFRRDSHDAARVDATETGLTLSLADGSTVTYESRDSTVIRQQQPATSQVAHSNIYRLLSGRIRFEHDAGAPVLRAIHQASSKDASTRTIAQTIEADVGLLSAASSAADPSNGEVGP